MFVYLYICHATWCLVAWNIEQRRYSSAAKTVEKTLNACSNELKAYLYSISSIQFQPDVFLNKVAVV